jgi:hypothetical protein
VPVVVSALRSSPDGGDEPGDGAWVPVLDLLGMDDGAILDRHGRWYIAGRDPRWVRRNALLVLGNSGAGTAPAVVAVLEAYLDHADPLLRRHAAWAARRLGLEALATARRGDPDVAAELALPAPPVAVPPVAAARR